MAKVFHLTNGEQNWSFAPNGDQVKLTITKGFGIVRSDTYGIEEGRELFAFVKKFGGKKGFTRLHKMRRLTKEHQVVRYDEQCREWYGEDNWPEFSLATWEEFHSAGCVTVLC
jgi:hypothetical protein